MVSKSQIDQLGDRLREGNVSEEDLRILNDYRRSFIGPYRAVVAEIRDGLKLEPTGRTPKTTASILDKLQREHVRLSQMQDIAGCRLIVENLANQDEVVGQLIGLFKNVTVDDRRERPSHGYRAVHLIVDLEGKLVEIQIRTELQQAWAELSEKLSDVFDRSIKYGGGNQAVVSLLEIASEVTMAWEEAIKDKNNVTIEQLRQALTQIKGLIDDIPN